MSSSRVSIVVLNWNGWEDTIGCLESLMRLRHDDYEVIVVDNASSDGSMEKIKAWATSRPDLFDAEVTEPGAPPLAEYFPEDTEAGREESGKGRVEAMLRPNPPLTLIHAGENLGYARGNNLGIRYALRSNSPSYVLVLNNDAVLERDSLKPLLEAFDKYPSAGLVGPKILDYEDGSDWEWPVAKRLDFWSILIIFTGLNRIFKKTKLYKSRFYQGYEDRKVYAIPGSCMFFSTDALEAIGGFDAETFLYWEEFIVAEKLRETGFDTYVIPDSRVHHKLGASTKKIGVGKFIENVRSENYYLLRYQRLSAIQALVVKILRIIAYAIRSVRHEDYRRRTKEFLRVLRAPHPRNYETTIERTENPGASG